MFFVAILPGTRDDSTYPRSNRLPRPDGAGAPSALRWRRPFPGHGARSYRRQGNRGAGLRGLSRDGRTEDGRDRGRYALALAGWRDGDGPPPGTNGGRRGERRGGRELPAPGRGVRGVPPRHRPAQGAGADLEEGELGRRQHRLGPPHHRLREVWSPRYTLVAHHDGHLGYA